MITLCSTEKQSGHERPERVLQGDHGSMGVLEKNGYVNQGHALDQGDDPCGDGVHVSV